MASNTYGILMPEMVIYKTLKAIFSTIKADFAENPEEETMLYRFFKKDENGNDIKWETFNHYDQAKDIFINKDTEIHLGYNLEVAGMGCVHILLPSETGSPLGIGADENYQDPITTTDGMANEYRQAVFTKKFDSTYQLMITSENTLEVLLIYNFIKACFISLNAHLELAGLRNPRFGGNDVNIQSDKVPTHIFHRSFSLNFFYEVHVPELFRNRLIKDFNSTGIISM